ncbi:hypothetical protein LA2_00090 [Lactobacillus amylovorus GRL 1112]|jgi:hypothetical protein|uniref:Uncharacterized protein n=1 Tax=Lactobacillus amylovorus (strain GRL 1112) TaxID=695560 RepID=E4SJ73_LACAR|nr:hypothetical protein LA2_00090 [Lactobacillus amylovorus GRL 1112]
MAFIIEHHGSDARACGPFLGSCSSLATYLPEEIKQRFKDDKEREQKNKDK